MACAISDAASVGKVGNVRKPVLFALTLALWAWTRSGAMLSLIEHPGRIPVGMNEEIAAAQAPLAQFPWQWNSHGSWRDVPPHDPGLPIVLRLASLIGQ